MVQSSWSDYRKPNLTACVEACASGEPYRRWNCGTYTSAASSINMTHRSPFIKEQSNVKCGTRTYKNYEAFTVQKHKDRMIELDCIRYRTPIGTRKYFPNDSVHDSFLFPPRHCAGGFKWPLGTSVCCSQSAKKTVATAHNDSQPVHGK